VHGDVTPGCADEVEHAVEADAGPVLLRPRPAPHAVEVDDAFLDVETREVGEREALRMRDVSLNEEVLPGRDLGFEVHDRPPLGDPLHALDVLGVAHAAPASSASAAGRSPYPRSRNRSSIAAATTSRPMRR